MSETIHLYYCFTAGFTDFDWFVIPDSTRLGERSLESILCSISTGSRVVARDDRSQN